MTIYFVRGEVTGLIKIGLANDVQSRLIDLRVGSPDRLVLLGTIPGTGETEWRLHSLFAANRVHGEWFALEAEDIAAIGMVVAMAARSQPVRFFSEPKLNALSAIAEREELLNRIEHLNKVAARLRAINTELRQRLDYLSPPIILSAANPETRLALPAGQRPSWWRRFRSAS